MRSTQRCESMNSYLNRFVHCRLKMYKFLKNIDRALDRIRNTFNDYQCSTTTPVYGTHWLGLEKHVAQTYTRNVLFLVREEIREEASLSIVNCVQDVDNYTYTFKKFGNANHIWTTRFIPSVNHIHCSCKMFETADLPCSHSFSVMKAMDMQHIPSSLILDRWTTRAKDFLAIKYACEATPTLIMEKTRYGSLSSKCSKMCYFASKSDDGFKETNGEIDKLTLRMQELMPSSPINSQNVSGVQHVHNVKDPSMAATKGSVRRKKNAGVKQRKCGKCGQPGHTAKTCHGNVRTNNSSVSTNAVHMYEQNLTQNNDMSYGCSSTGPSYSFTFPVNDDYGGDTKHDLEYGNIGFDPSSSTFDMHGYPCFYFQFYGSNRNSLVAGLISGNRERKMASSSGKTKRNHNLLRNCSDLIRTSSFENTPPDPPNTFSVEASLLQRKPLSIFDHPLKNGPSKLYIQFMEIKEGKSKIEEYNISCFGMVRASCNGLILVDNRLKRGGLIVMNPVTRKLIALPVGTINPRNESFGFALSEVTGEYKVVHLFQDKLGYISCETINLGTRVWREVNGPSFGLFQTFEHKPVSAIGALHWLPEIRINDYIVSMEVDNETFHTLSLPKTGGCYDRIIEKDGFLCFVTHEELNIDIWILKGLYGEVWTKHYSLTNGSVIDMVPLLSFKVSGDMVFVRNEDGSYYVYNFKLQMMTKVEMEEGIAGHLLPSCYLMSTVSSHGNETNDL
ncbi:hypothetical protein LWI29_002804 [Acer saccharum]|uniref:Protein FAR1-RELATED SEQUENCE n=1 Tax=Acer saccharum TaxID=4024 RepID=A0AA39VEX8_ACESA|nr:hypothetical protein LWI29_002804 [Acer saccharum]